MNVLGLSFSKVFLILSAFLLLTNCASPRVTVMMLKPAEINLAGVKKIAIGEIKGNAGIDTSNLLTEKLFNKSDLFEVVDRQNLERIMKEHKLNSTGIVDGNTAVEIGKFMGAAALIFGDSNSKYKLKRTRGDSWRDKEGRSHVKYYAKGTAIITTSLRVVGLTTGKILATKRIVKTTEKTNSSTDERPEEPNKDALLESALTDVIDEFMRMIAPYQEPVTVRFEDPETDFGKTAIKYAKQAQWELAIGKFKEEKRLKPMIVGSWYNLGVAYSYSGQYDLAKETLTQANKIAPCEKCTQELVKLKKYIKDRKELEIQRALN